MGEFRSSSIVAGKHLYLANLEGTVHLLDIDDPNHEWETFEFREPIEATPVALDSPLIIRTETSLFGLR